MQYKIFSLSENALTIDFGNEISVDFNEKVIQLDEIIKKNNFAGFIETVPAYSSLTIFFDLIAVRKSFSQFPNALSAVKNHIEISLQNLKQSKKNKARLIKIPVDYSAEFAPDLEFVAINANISTKEVIKIHTSQTYRVFMIGFLPAFAYMGEIDERIAAPRKETPRTNIAKGSVGIAGKQTGIYPLESPGGWQIIGKTDLEIFQPKSKEISLLKTGDLVKFYDINQK
ncbi:MAG: 5-oxoprolinase subunit PxpB [Acidobacteriota bacterium]